MAPFIYTKRNGIHILDLQQTTKFVDEVHAYVQELVGAGKSILFVGTKKQAQDAVREEATKCGMPYIHQRWPGGLLTNKQTIGKRLERLRELRKQRDEGYFETLTKKDRKFLSDELDQLDKVLGGMADLHGTPDALFIVDVKKEVNAVREARKLGIPIIGILDTNCDPDDVDYKLPGNDDAIRSIRLFCQIVADSVMQAKYGYLPPDSVFIRAAEEDDDTEMAAALAGKAPSKKAPKAAESKQAAAEETHVAEVAPEAAPNAAAAPDAAAEVAPEDSPAAEAEEAPEELAAMPVPELAGSEETEAAAAEA
jgi:small subunit ribosomal protein S2